MDVLNHCGRLFSERTAENIAERIHSVPDLAYVATQVAEVSVHFVQCGLRLREPGLDLVLGRGQVLNRLLGVFDSITILALKVVDSLEYRSPLLVGSGLRHLEPENRNLGGVSLLNLSLRRPSRREIRFGRLNLSRSGQNVIYSLLDRRKRTTLPRLLFEVLNDPHDLPELRWV